MAYTGAVCMLCFFQRAEESFEEDAGLHQFSNRAAAMAVGRAG